jgi:hypothetical protein
MTTDHAKEHWLSSFPEWQTYVDKIDNMMPEEREAILSRYRV